MKTPIYYFLLLLFVFGMQGESFGKTITPTSKYWVYFTDKDIENYDYRTHLSNKAISQRMKTGTALVQFTDIPIKVSYLNRLATQGIQLLQISKWLNAVSVEANFNQIERLKEFPFVKLVKPLNTHMKVCSLPKETGLKPKYGKALEQMEIDAFKEESLNGEGITIGVIDAGFYRADESELLEAVFKEERLLGIQDFVNPKKKAHFSEKESGMDSHGTQVVQFIAGKNQGMQIGFAPAAMFYWARTDHGNKEWRGEEDNWIRAMEWMDSLGVRLINTSLGYALGFDEPSENYKPEEMDGETSAIARACNIATEEKNMIIVVSAGNEGSDRRWRIVSTPADAKGVISVGATNYSGLKAGYSSIGPSFLSYLKPNVATYAVGGTSFSAPIITGFVACLLQFDATLSNQKIVEIVEKSGHLYPYGNNYVGYGIPKASRAIQLLKEDTLTHEVEKIEALNKVEIALPLNVATSSSIILFHKKNETEVIKQEKVELGSQLVVKRPKNVGFTTIVTEKKTYEVIWEK